MDNEAGLDLQDWSVRERSYKKSPISMIKEIAEKINIPCQYELLDNYDLTPNNVFKYRLTLGDYQTVADGPSKKSAKHQVALNMIKQIKKHNPILSGTEFNQIDFGNQVDDCNKIDANCVDRLAKACTIKNLVEPVYKQVCEDAVKQEAQMIDIATCKTKTEDENLTAHQMLGKLESMEFHRSMTPEQENNDPIKNLEDIEIDKNQGKQSINAVITEK
ncbi:Double-stranded RNA-binding domain, partial [Cinara cedri]